MKGRWYFMVTVFSGGVLAWLPFVHAGNHLRRPSVTRLAISTIALGCLQQAPLRREVYGGAPPPERDAVDPALTAALEARSRRADARQIAARDPLLARDLKIGRPDLPHTFDDGGLVDLNSASAQTIAETCDLPRAIGENIAAARPPGGFMAVDDVFTLAEVPIAAWDVIRDRAVVIPRPH